MGLSAQERLVVAGIGTLALVSLGLLLWDRAQPARQRPEPRQASSWDHALSSARRVDINAAGVDELQRLPGIGPSLAGRIVAYRDAHGSFASAAELSRVSGIEPGICRALEEYVTVGTVR